ncbi:MAG: hypothetical protein M3Z32_09715 [Acidobacteriota bacterium]|nr:hypothetical protein [Acidobacteriota bacterium]
MLKRITIFVVLCYVLLLGVAYGLMRQPPERFAAAIARMPGPLFLVLPFETFWSSARAGTLGAGQMAPDFRLKTLDRTGEVELANFRGKRPVVLIFGSYT